MESSIAEIQQFTRRHLFGRAAGGLGAAALSTLMQESQKPVHAAGTTACRGCLTLLPRQNG